MLGAAGSFLTIPEVARVTNTPAYTMRRRLLRLSKRWPGLLVSLAPPGRRPGKYFVDARVLERIDRLGEHHDRDAEVRELQARIADLEEKADALRKAYLRLKRTLSAKPAVSR